MPQNFNIGLAEFEHLVRGGTVRFRGTRVQIVLSDIGFDALYVTVAEAAADGDTRHRDVMIVDSD